MILSRLTSFALLIAALAWPARAAEPPSAAPRWFAQTGHTLAYNFRRFWEQNGGLPIFGYPISEVFIEDRRPVQYFERARLEWHGDLGIVEIGHLGRWAIQQRPPAAVASANGQPGSDGDYFAATGHSLSGGFRQFWRANGALSIFVLPLSEEFREIIPQDGNPYTVQ
jgi:hypothetical protein